MDDRPFIPRCQIAIVRGFESCIMIPTGAQSSYALGYIRQSLVRNMTLYLVQAWFKASRPSIHIILTLVQGKNWSAIFIPAWQRLPRRRSNICSSTLPSSSTQTCSLERLINFLIVLCFHLFSFIMTHRSPTIEYKTDGFCLSRLSTGRLTLLS